MSEKKTTVASVAKENLVTKVMNLLKGGDKAKVTRFASQIDKYIDKQIKIKEEKISDLRERILEDSVNNVDLEQLTDIDSMKNYCPLYLSGVLASMGKSDSLLEDIKRYEDEIKKLDEAKERIFIEKSSSSKENDKSA